MVFKKLFLFYFYFTFDNPAFILLSHSINDEHNEQDGTQEAHNCSTDNGRQDSWNNKDSVKVFFEGNNIRESKFCEGDITLNCKLHQYPKFNKHVHSFDDVKALGT